MPAGTLLHDVLGIRPRARKPERQIEGGAHVRQRQALEAGKSADGRPGGRAKSANGALQDYIAEALFIPGARE